MTTLSTGWSAARLAPRTGNTVLPSGVYRAGAPMAGSVRAPTPAGGNSALQSALARAIGIGSPVTNTEISGVSNADTLASQNQNLPPWLLNAVSNLQNPDNFSPALPAGGGFDPRVGATMAATEARIAAQQKALVEENKAKIARVKADAAAAENAQNANIQRLSGGWGAANYQSGWGPAVR